jgi:hypothetical protein
MAVSTVKMCSGELRQRISLRFLVALGQENLFD